MLIQVLISVFLIMSCRSTEDKLSQLEADSIPSKQARNGVLLQAFHWYSEGGGVHWNNLKAKASKFSKLGITALWLPPAYKGSSEEDVGYGVYDLWDLGEFKQKNPQVARTKYGSKAEYLALIDSLHRHNIEAYADVVVNHKLGADGTRMVLAKEVNPSSRNQVVSGAYEIKAYVNFDFPGRHRDPVKKLGADFKWEPYHFTGVDYDDNTKANGKIFLFEGEGKRWNPDVSTENGNYDYLMGADVDVSHPEVRGQLIDWGSWYVKEAKLDGFRIDAVKHISSEFIPTWVKEVRKKSAKPNLFAVGEYWSYDLGLLDKYLNQTNANGESNVSLFDAPLHNNFHAASKSSGNYDMRKIFDGTLVQVQPTRAVTLVENHDTQPLQALESVVDSWFKPLAYALILLREGGYPCIFLPDLEGAKYRDRGRDGKSYDIVMDSHEKSLTLLLNARANYAYGAQRDFLDDQNIIGWTREGAGQFPKGLANLMSDGPGGKKWMDLGKIHAGQCFINIFNKTEPCIKINNDGYGEFVVSGGAVAVYVQESEVGRF